MLHPKQFRVNEAWIAFQLNGAPVVTIRDGSFNCVCLMDAASCYIMGHVMVPADQSEPSALEAKRLLRLGWAHKSAYPSKLLVPAGRYQTDLAAEAKRQDIAFVPVPASHLRSFTSDAREGFREFLRGKPR